MVDKPGHMVNLGKENENTVSFCKIFKIPAIFGLF